LASCCFAVASVIAAYVGARRYESNKPRNTLNAAQHQDSPKRGQCWMIAAWVWFGGAIISGFSVLTTSPDDEDVTPFCFATIGVVGFISWLLMFVYSEQVRKATSSSF